MGVMFSMLLRKHVCGGWRQKTKQNKKTGAIWENDKCRDQKGIKTLYLFLMVGGL